MNWDFIVTILVLLILVLLIWAKVSKQTVKDVILDIVDIFRHGKEEVQDRAEEVILYE